MFAPQNESNCTVSDAPFHKTYSSNSKQLSIIEHFYSLDYCTEDHEIKLLIEILKALMKLGKDDARPFPDVLGSFSLFKDLSWGCLSNNKVCKCVDNVRIQFLFTS